MSPSFGSLPGRVRRLTARRRWVRAVPPLLLGVGTFLAVERADDAATAARDGWGEVATVWIAELPAEPGDTLVVERHDVPVRLVPEGAAEADRQLVGSTARRAVAAGAIVTDIDVGVRPGPLGLVPEGWLIVAVVESPSVGAGVGEAVQVASDGIVLAADAVVIEAGADRTLLAVPGDVAPMIAFAVAQGAVSLLRTGR